MSSLNIYLPPITMNVEGCEVYIMNVVKTKNLFNQDRFIISCRVKCRGVLSKQFTLDVSSNEEFMRLIKYEIALFKSIIYAGTRDIYES
jgi:hypothetical protein